MKCCLGLRDKNDLFDSYDKNEIFEPRNNLKYNNLINKEIVLLKLLFKNLNTFCIKFKLLYIISQLKCNYKNSLFFKKKNSKKERIKKEIKLMQSMINI